jgi:hypothetical protein
MPVSRLKRHAKTEFDRLIVVLRRRGTLERVDMGTVTELARVKALLDAEHARPGEPDAARLKAIAILTNLRRGLTRELGLTLQPSRATYRVNPGHGSANAGHQSFAHLLGDGTDGD